ncbi:MAG TPA: hypothetical protein VJM10_03945, partial [Candidatus Methylomirabilis sp.]|nr:hypothetical protein [Candidatus Methylomirabilis sp.]
MRRLYERRLLREANWDGAVKQASQLGQHAAQLEKAASSEDEHDAFAALYVAMGDVMDAAAALGAGRTAIEIGKVMDT